jgi:hypothetical protein
MTTTPKPHVPEAARGHALKLRVLEAARGHPAGKRPDLLSERFGVPAMVLLLAAGAMSLALWIAGGPAHAAGRPFIVSAWIVGGTALLAVVATSIALPPARSMLPRASGQLLAVMIGVPIVIGLWVGFWHSNYQEPFARTGFRCFALTALTAPWPFVALAALRRRFDPVQPMLSGGALGAAAGAWAAVMVELWCPLSNASHLAIGHVAPLVVLVLAGAIAGRRLFRLRRLEDGRSLPAE